jgi:hypothetical protein
MNVDKQKTLVELSRRSPFGICLVVFLLLACDYGFRLVGLWNQREQLNQALLTQVQNASALSQAQQVERRLESLSLDLLALAKTNAAAKQIVQEFNIQWTPGPGASASPPATTNQSK